LALRDRDTHTVLPTGAATPAEQIHQRATVVMARHQALVVSYSIGGDHRSVRLGGPTVICTAPTHYRCRLPEPLPTT
jgi:hypothetical protein